MTLLETAVAEASTPAAISREVPQGRAAGFWGMSLLVLTEATLFACLLASYFYLRFKASPQWPLGGIKPPELPKPLVMTALLVPSSLPMAWAERGIKHGHATRLKVGLALTFVLGLSFLALQGTEYHSKLQKFTPSTNVYGSLFYAITGFHGFHVFVGLVMISFALATALKGRATEKHHPRVQMTAIYWHFVDAVWVAILFTVYLSPHL